jgi:hypothetical protein
MPSALHVFCRHDEPVAASGREAELKILADQYRLGVETQMHFNQLIMRTRSLGMYGALLVMGSALLLRSQYPDATPFRLDIVALGLVVQLSASAVISLFGPVLLLIVYLMDRHYYLRLLYGINSYVYSIERGTAEQGLTLVGIPNAFRQGLFIQQAFGQRAGASIKFVKASYFLVLVTELAVIVALVANP